MKNPKVKRWVVDTVKIFVGSLIAAAGFRYLTFPNSIVSGGITGIAQIANLLTGTPVGMMSLALNIPLFIWAWEKLGRHFVLLTGIGMLAYSVCVDALEFFPLTITSDPLLAAVYGGVVCGAGYGIVYTTGATGGGVDIPARLLRRKYPHINFTLFVLAFNLIVIVAFALIFHNFDSCMYTVIFMYIATKVEDLFLYGPNNSRLCYIISDRSEELRVGITQRLGRGATMLEGRGAWSNKEKQVILCVIKPMQITPLRRLVREIDANAFLVVGDARGVYGQGFESIDSED